MNILAFYAVRYKNLPPLLPFEKTDDSQFLFCTMSMYLESKIVLVEGTKIEGKDAHWYSSCPVSVKLNQLILVTTEPFSTTSRRDNRGFVYFALNIFFAFIITAFARVFIQGRGVEGQQPRNEVDCKTVGFFSKSVNGVLR